MSELSKVVDKLVADYEVEQERKLASSEAQQVRAVLQGMLAGTAVEMIRGGVLAVADVDLPQDDEGDYEPYFIVETRSGLRFRVSVDIEA